MEETGEMKGTDINFIPVRSSLDWDQYFMFQAMMASMRSKDPSTKVGAVFVDANNRQLTMGYNGTVAGIDEQMVPWGNDKSVPLEFQKYGYVIHAEANAMLHCQQSLEGARGYVTLFPCNECAKMIAANKVSEIVYMSDKYKDSSENRIARKIFDLAGVQYRKLEIEPLLIDKVSDYLHSLAD